MLVPINDIQIGKRLRALREAAVGDLAESIARLGLQCPISVAKGIEKRPGNSDGVTFHLVAGNHRLAACKRLGWTEIEAQIVQMDGGERELWEIDENLCRADLTELERGEHLARRKEIYETLHPETKKGAAQALGMNAAVGNNVTDNLSATFAEDTADKAGVTDRDIRRSIRRVTKIDAKVRDRIRELPDIADSGVELDALAQMDTAQQRKAVALVESGQAAGIRDAKKLMEPKASKIVPHFKAAAEAEEKQFLALMKAWNAAGQSVRERFMAEVDQPVADNSTALRVV